jgi:putative sigma-54 modulation protein
MNRRIKRLHERKIGRGRRAAVNLGELAVAQADAVEAAEPDELEVGNVARTKRFKIQPMDVDEAIEQLELLGHDFFIFYNPDAGKLNVLYRRKDGGYGVIEPELA